MANLVESFREVVAALNRATVPFAVCGGLALAIHARPRATVDIDLLAPSTAIPALEQAVQPLGFSRRGQVPMRLASGAVVMHGFTRIVPGDPDVLTLDVIEALPGVTGDAWVSRLSMSWQDQTVAVVSRQALVAMKRLRGSRQDLADVEALEDA